MSTAPIRSSTSNLRRRAGWPADTASGAGPEAVEGLPLPDPLRLDRQGGELGDAARELADDGDVGGGEAGRGGRLGERLGRVRQSIGRVIFGQQEVIDLSLMTLLAGGHLLLIGVPGLAKTRLVETLGTVLGLAERRIQCTPETSR